MNTWRKKEAKPLPKITKLTSHRAGLELLTFYGKEKLGEFASESDEFLYPKYVT